MRLSPREQEGLLIHQTGFLAQKRLARGLKLNQPEAVALIACQVSCMVGGPKVENTPVIRRAQGSASGNYRM